MRSVARRSGLRAALAPHWGALLALALFLVVGLAVLDDYGVTADESLHRNVALATLRYMQGEQYDLPPDKESHRFYGSAFQLPLLYAERVLGLQDSRGIHLSRRLIMHLSYLVGGLFAYFLARRLFRNRLLALFALLLAALHPRLYAHSFFNNQDIPFAAMFVIALFLTHRAFKRDSVSAFVLLGVGVGALVNLRVMGAILLAGIPALRAVDLAFAPRWAERKRVLLTTAAFALASVLTAYALMPYLWPDPLAGAAEWWTSLSTHGSNIREPFRGTVLLPYSPPHAEYIPVWFAVTSPPFAMLLGLVGAALILFAAAKNLRLALRNTRLRFGLLLAGCYGLPILAVIFLSDNAYNDWRHFYYLWPPFALIALFGLQRLASAFRQARLRAAVYGGTAAGLAATLISMALVHPNQQASFNFFVDRPTPEYLRTQFVMDYWGLSARQVLEWLVNRNSEPVKVNAPGRDALIEQNLLLMPRADAERVEIDRSADALVLDFWIAAGSDNALHSVKAYNNSIAVVREAPLQARDEARTAYESTIGREPRRRSFFNVFYADGALVYVREPCERRVRSDVYLLVYPQDAGDLPRGERGLGRSNHSFNFHQFGSEFDGKCVAAVPLPDYPIAGVRTGQGGDAPWEAAFSLTDPGAYSEAFASAKEADSAARSVFDLYLLDGALVYVKEPCGQADTEARFFLHVVPERLDDIHGERRAAGFDNLDFAFFTRGAHFNGGCAASVPLPGYPVASIRTGQFSSEGELWRAEFAPADG